ncbi:hypothetical protein M885DRAFT_531071 [Pelagophyceae sp. CCMP2097]|nr:hypothetical protein M885DRAFT_531071 [Pelagophyceae sp. CCMP2097]
MSESVAIRIKDTGVQPDDAEVESLFARVLHALLIPDAAREQLIGNESIANKWRMVQMNAALLASQAASTTFGEDDVALLAELRAAPARAAVAPLVELRKRLSTSSRGWLGGFYARGGVEVLVEVLVTAGAGAAAGATYTEVEGFCVLEAFACVRQLVNHRSGLETATASSGATGLFRAVAAAALREPWSVVGAALAAVGLRLLAVAAHYSHSPGFLADAEYAALAAACAAGGKGDGADDRTVPPAVVAAVMTLANELIIAQDDVPPASL